MRKACVYILPVPNMIDNGQLPYTWRPHLGGGRVEDGCTAVEPRWEGARLVEQNA